MGLGTEIAGRPAHRQHQEPGPQHLGARHQVVHRRNRPLRRSGRRDPRRRSPTCSCGHRAAASRRRSPRRTPAARAAAEQAITRLASVTATGAVADRPAAAAAATAGQSMHQMANTREDTGIHPARARAVTRRPAHTPLTCSRTRLIRPKPGRLARGDLVAADPGLKPRGRPLPVTVGDQQGAPLVAGPRHHRPRPGLRHPAPAQAEDHQIHAVDEHRGHLHRIGSGIRYHREPAQVGPHLRGGQQADIRLADDCRRCRPPPSPRPPCPAAATGLPRAPPPSRAAAAPAATPPATAAAPAGIPIPAAGRRRGGLTAPRRLPGDHGHPPAKRFELLSAVFLPLIGGESRSHDQPPTTALARLFSKVCSTTLRVNTRPPTTVKKREGRLMRSIPVGRMGAMWRHFRVAGGDPAPRTSTGYSHSMVPGGLLVMSSTTRLTSATSLVMRVEMRSSTS